MLALYGYRARDANGRVVTGTLDADDDRDAIRQLRERKLTPTQLTVQVEGTAPGQSPWSLAIFPNFLKRQVKLKSLALFCRQLSTMIGAGLSILVSLRIIADQSADKALREVIDGVIDRLEGGEALSEAFQHHIPTIPPLMVHMIEAGEVGGILEEVFVRMAEQFDRESTLNEKVKSAMVYPKIVITAAAAMVVFLVVRILPTFMILFSQFDVELPLITRAVIAFGDFTRGNLGTLLALVAAIYIALKMLPKTAWGRARLDRLVLKVPVLGDLYLKRSMARFTRTLATLLESGVPILTALRVAERTLDNWVLEQSVERARENVRAGRTLSGPLREDGHFPRMIVEMTAVGEETGALDVMLYKAADFYEQETAHTVDRLTSLLEPIMVVGVAGVVGLIIASVFLPIYSVLGAIQ